MLEEVPFTGLASREDNNRIPFEAAYEASDCYTDTDAVVGRNGSRTATASAIAGSGTPQHLGRFRPDILSARNVVVIAGTVYLITDPTTETASDGAVTNLGTPTSWDGTEVVSGVALGTSYYLSTDKSGVAWARINWASPDTYTLENMGGLPTPGIPGMSHGGATAFTLFSGLTRVESGLVQQDNSKAGFTGMDSTWRGFSRTDGGNNDPIQGSYAYYNLGFTADATGFDWLAVAVSPHDGTSNFEVTVSVAIDVAGSPGTWNDIGAIYDVQPVADSPNLLYCDLRNLTSTVKGFIRYMKFTLTGSKGGKFIVYGVIFLPAAPVSNPSVFYVDILNASTGQFSRLSPPLPVTVAQPPGNLATYPDSRMGNDVAHKSGNSDQLIGSSNQRIFNRWAGVPMPEPQDIGEIITISGNLPAFSTPASVSVRLWEDTSEGRRLVATQTGVATGGAYGFIVRGGTDVLRNDLYVPGGVAPRASCITAHAQRLVAMYRNRVFISSYVPTSADQTTHPFPQWPDIAVEDSNGWSFDVCPSPREVGQVVNGDGDALYIVTNESWYFMSDLSPNSPVFQVFKRGAMGKQSGYYAEDRFFVASWDGVYMGVGRSNPIEMTEEIRTIYQSWLVADSSVALGYDPAQRALFVFEGTKYLRYRFPIGGRPGRWTRGTVSENVRFCLSFMGLVHYGAGTTSTDPQFWHLTSLRRIGRWQTSATRDLEVGTDAATGAALPSWVYSTGFAPTPAPAIVKGILIDATGTVSVTEAKTIAAVDPSEARTVSVAVVAHQDEAWAPMAGDLRGQKFRLSFTAGNTIKLRRAAWERGLIEGKGG